MASVAAVLETQKFLESILMKKMGDLEAQLKSSSSKKDGDNLLKIQEEFNTFKNVVHNILQLLRQQITEVIKSVDAVKTRHRQKCLLLSGLPEKSDAELANNAVSLLQKHLGLCEITGESIKACYRLGRYKEGRNRPVVIEFTGQHIRSLIWKNKTRLKGSDLVLEEFLTRSRQSAFRAAREHFGMKSVWTSSGNICISTPDGNKVRILSMDELNMLTTRFPKPSPVATVLSEESSVVLEVSELSTALSDDPTQSSKAIQTRSKRVNKSSK
ncbi:unnamed protein product [Chilo suppressalis]|uniref:Uncharacterized protein n=1 Tax=Chilo suppressalis TaxID=168631 RepID=A0ABN8AZJ5_CHISP|nr:unnamed protein product [Chilo suppressalis]